MLISTVHPASHLDDPNWLLFDCRHDLLNHSRGAELYAQNHIPGAYFIPFEETLAGPKNGINGRHPLPNPEAFTAFLNQHGATAETQIIAYDDVGGQYAARLWWLTRWIGHQRVAILDGGLGKWLSENRPLTTARPTPKGGGTLRAQPNSMSTKSAAQIQAALETPSQLIIDARTPERYRGETEPIDPVAGHIPTAKNRFFKLNLNADGTLRSPAELRADFTQLLGSRTPTEVVHQCGSGVTACVNLLAMEHAGLTGSKLYVGSWSEWCADSTRPIAKG